MADLEGGLDELRPATVLEFLGATRKTGMLRVAGRHATVTVWLHDGAAVAAESTTDDTELLDQLVELLRTPAGSFKFTEGDLPQPDRAHRPEVDLLPRAVDRLHEWETLADAVPSLSLHVKLLNADSDDVQLSGAAWSLSVAVSSGHASVGAAAKHLKWGSYKTCKAVRELVDAGRATLVPPPSRRRGAGHRSVAAPVEDVTVAGAAPAWHPANQPLWPGAGSSERDRFTSAWAYDE